LNILAPTTRDIPPVQLSKLEKAPKDELKEYLNQIGKEYEKYNANRKLTASTLQSLTKEQHVGANGDVLEEEKDGLDTIPEVFFSENFNLDDPRVFKLVTEGQSVESMNESLQEKISWYLDTIEIHLVNEISKSSGSFFDALNDLNEINEKNSKIVGLINDLRNKLEIVKEKKILHNLKRIELQKKRDNVAKLEQGLVQVNTVILQSKEAEGLLLQSDYEKCLDKIDYVEHLLRGKCDDLKWPYELQDLRGIAGLSPCREKLCNMRSQAGQSYAKLLTDFLLTDLRSHYEEIEFTESLERLMKGTNYQSPIGDEFRSRLADYIIGLSRSEEIATAFKSYEDAVINEMKNLVRVFLPNEERSETKDSTSTASSSGNKPTSLSVLIKSMTPREFEIMLIKIFTTVSEGLRRLTVHQKLLMDLALSNMAFKEQDQSNLMTQLDIRSCITKSIEIIQIRMGKITLVRKDLTSSLRYDYFLRFYYINSKFLEECENISGLTFKYLPDILAQQIKSFNASFQHTNLKRISASLGLEEWRPMIVSPELQDVVSKILDKKKLDSAKHWKQELTHINDVMGDQHNEEESSSHKRSIVVGDKTFVASQSLLVSLGIIKDILILRENFNQLGSVYEGYMVEVIEYYKNRAMQEIKKPDGSLDKDKNISIVNESLDCLTELLERTREVQQW
jgi:vacuolar protein sorting-associated protein 54